MINVNIHFVHVCHHRAAPQDIQLEFPFTWVINNYTGALRKQCWPGKMFRQYSEGIQVELAVFSFWKRLGRSTQVDGFCSKNSCTHFLIRKTKKQNVPTLGQYCIKQMKQSQWFVSQSYLYLERWPNKLASLV